MPTINVRLPKHSTIDLQESIAKCIAHAVHQFGLPVELQQPVPYFVKEIGTIMEDACITVENNFGMPEDDVEKCNKITRINTLVNESKGCLMVTPFDGEFYFPQYPDGALQDFSTMTISYFMDRKRREANHDALYKIIEVVNNTWTANSYELLKNMLMTYGSTFFTPNSFPKEFHIYDPVKRMFYVVSKTNPEKVSYTPGEWFKTFTKVDLKAYVDWERSIPRELGQSFMADLFSLENKS